MRVSSRTLVDNALNNVHQNYQKLMRLQQQLTSGRRVNRLSDDPAIAGRALNYRSQLGIQQQLMRNIDTAKARVDVTETALSDVSTIIQRARELAVSGANATKTATDRGLLAAEVRQMIDHVIQTGNLKFNGQYVFSGTAVDVVPFTPVGDPPVSVTYNGNSGLIDRQIDEGSRISINVPGDNALATTFTALINLYNGLTTGVGITATIGDIDTALNGVLQLRGQLGAKVNRLDTSKGQKEEAMASTQLILAQNEEADLADVITRLSSQEATYQASLAATTRSIQSSILNYLR